MSQVSHRPRTERVRKLRVFETARHGTYTWGPQATATSQLLDKSGDESVQAPTALAIR